MDRSLFADRVTSVPTRRQALRLLAGAALAAGLAPAGVRAVRLSGVSATVNVATLNVRSGPDTSHPIVGRLDRGTEVACLATAGSWFKVRIPSLTGFVYSPYVTLV